MKHKQSDYISLDPAHTDPKRVKKERENARKLKQSQWWRTLVGKGLCHYCQKTFKSSELTLDHIVPIARGGRSVKGNVVPACPECNRDKKLTIPVEDLFAQIAKEREKRENSED